MNITGLRILTAFFLLQSATAVVAQTESPETRGERLRIGVALGGGGARGAAHIGVLRELERLRIPVDAIAGTSMGAIVGGLYAAGMTPAELQELVESLDWADAFDDQTQRENRSFRRKQDDNAYAIPLELGVSKGSLQMPRGLIQGQKLSLILREHLLHVYDVQDFDDLPTPFRAVAADIATGEAYIMANGDIELAMRASMSAPGVFAPVVVDGRALVDGGLVGNVPVSVVRDMGVDIVIAVDVEFPLYPPEQLESALAITEQMLTILIRKETRRELEGLNDDDILIRPKLGLYGSSNFVDIVDTIEPGAAAAIDLEERLARLSLSEQDFAAFQATRRKPAALPERYDFVRLIEDGRPAASVRASRIRTAPGDAVDAAQLGADAAYLFGRDLFEQASYRLVRDGEQTGVEFTTRSKSWGPNFLNFGISIEDDFEGATRFNVAGRLTSTGFNAHGAEWRTDAQVGTDPLLRSEFYQPFGKTSRFFVAPRITLEETNINIFNADAALARYRVGEAEAALDLGRILGRWGEIRLGAFRGTGNARLKVGDPALTNFDFSTGGASARLAVDTFDDAQIPKSGTQLNVEWLMSRPGFGADNNFDILSSTIDTAWSWKRHTLVAGLEYATTIQGDNQIQDFFPLGGFLRLSGLERGAISGPHAGLARLVYYREVGDTGAGLFDFPLYIGGSVEAGNVWRNRSDMDIDSLLVNGSIFAGLDTYLGALFLAAGFAEGGSTSFYLFLGSGGL
ncbi:MAG: patatin-like phospholipase family protein [Woeseiaceae bacterium]|nr:patatin-like phospholipase family protein [Woeseiaceae bacterium]